MEPEALVQARAVTCVWCRTICSSSGIKTHQRGVQCKAHHDTLVFAREGFTEVRVHGLHDGLPSWVASVPPHLKKYGYALNRGRRVTIGGDRVFEASEAVFVQGWVKPVVMLVKIQVPSWRTAILRLLIHMDIDEQAKDAGLAVARLTQNLVEVLDVVGDIANWDWREELDHRA